MHLFRIELYLVDPESGLTIFSHPQKVLYAENHEDARAIYNEYYDQKYENNLYKYTIKLAVLSYKNIDDPKTFLNQFES